MKKRIVVALSAVAIALSGRMTVLAAPEVVQVSGNEMVFDYDYYAQSNPDVVNAVGMDKNVLLLHYLLYGQKEGRQPYAPGTDLAAVYKTNNAEDIQTEKKRLEAKLEYKGKYVEDECYFEYDSQGRKTGEYHYWGLSLNEWSIYSYDDQGNMVRMDYHYHDPRFDHWYEYQYEDQGNLIWEASFNNSHDGIDYWKEHSYDSMGKRLRTNHYLDDGSLSFGVDYIYDDQGHLLTENYCDKDGNSEGSWTEYQYDEKGNQILKIYHGVYADGGADWYIYSYDDEGYLETEAFYLNGELYHTYMYVYE